jgi:hypothetical protein
VYGVANLWRIDGKDGVAGRRRGPTTVREGSRYRCPLSRRGAEPVAHPVVSATPVRPSPQGVKRRPEDSVLLDRPRRYGAGRRSSYGRGARVTNQRDRPRRRPPGRSDLDRPYARRLDHHRLCDHRITGRHLGRCRRPHRPDRHRHRADQRHPYTFTVAATNPDGPSPPSDPSAPVTPGPPAATTLTLAVSPTSVLQGGTVQFSGRLQQANTAEGIAGETLAIERRPKGTTSWSTLASLTTASDGTLDPIGAAIPQAYTDYRLRHAATPFCAASISRIVTVRVGVRLTARLSRPSGGSVVDTGEGHELG